MMNLGQTEYYTAALLLPLGVLVAFYMGHKILVKRCIACPGQPTNIDADGNVYVDSKLLDAPYLTEKPRTTVTLNCPARCRTSGTSAWGDHCSTWVDSRSTTVACVSSVQIVGKIVFRVWPPPDFGALR